MCSSAADAEDGNEDGWSIYVKLRNWMHSWWCDVDDPRPGASLTRLITDKSGKRRVENSCQFHLSERMERNEMRLRGSLQSSTWVLLLIVMVWRLTYKLDVEKTGTINALRDWWKRREYFRWKIDFMKCELFLLLKNSGRSFKKNLVFDFKIV